MSVLGIWLLIAGACVVGCAGARRLGRRIDDAEKAQSQAQWQAMCDVLDLEDLGARPPDEIRQQSEGTQARIS